MLKTILISLASVVVAFVIVVAMEPANFRIARSATIAAPPAIVFAEVNDLRRWEAWSPWAKMDPAAKNTFAAPPAGTGAAMTWDGNKQVGEGTMTITESRPDALIRFRLDFRRPFQATHTAEFTFQPQGNQTVVTWSMSGVNGFLFKAVGLFMNTDKMVGPQFERGLADLKTISEVAASR